MKKQYITPEATALVLHTESVLAKSGEVDPGAPATGAEDSGVQGWGYSNSIWED